MSTRRVCRDTTVARTIAALAEDEEESDEDIPGPSSARRGSSSAVRRSKRRKRDDDYSNSEEEEEEGESGEDSDPTETSAVATETGSSRVLASRGRKRASASQKSSGKDKKKKKKEKTIEEQFDEDVLLDESNGWTKTEETPPMVAFEAPVGPAQTFTGTEGALRFFELFFSDDVWTLLVDNTNLYAAKELDVVTEEEHCRTFHDVTVEEMKAFFGVLIFMGINHLPRLEQYWSTKNFYIQSNLSHVFPLIRFEQISRFLHVSNPHTEIPPGEDGYDKLGKVRPLIDSLKQSFAAEFNLPRDIAVDEAMIPFKGRLSFKQYIKSKPHKYGIKVFVLSASNTGYIYDFNVYTGASDQVTEYSLCSQAVMDLVSPLSGLGHVVYTDNYYTSPELYEWLLEREIYACGTCKPGRKCFPKQLAVKYHPPVSKVERGYYDWFSRDGDLTACLWFDRRYVHFLSTAHVSVREDGTLPTIMRKDGRNKIDLPCPPLLADYIKNMRGVDRGDQLISLYNAGRKSVKAWKRMLFYMLECAILNAYIIEGYVDERHRSTGRRRDYEAFRIELANSLIDGFTSRKIVPHRDVSIGRLNPKLDHLAVYSPEKKRCVVCQQRKVRHWSRVKCSGCNVHLCVADGRNCFQQYHTLKNF